MEEWFKARLIWGSALMGLSDAEVGRFAKALWNYAMTGQIEELKGAEGAIFAMALAQLGQDDLQRKAVSSARSAAGSKGGRPKKANAFDEKQKNQLLFEKAKKANKNIDIDDEEDNISLLTQDTSKGIRAIRDNVPTLSSGNFEEIREFIDAGITDDLLCWAVDEAMAHGACNWSYIRAVLNSMLTNNVTTVAQAKQLSAQKAEQRRKRQETKESGVKPVYNPFLDRIKEGQS